MKKDALIYGLALILVGITQLSMGQITQTFNYTGGKQIFVVPSCVSEISITCYGAQGANGHDSLINGSGKLSPGGTGGLGAIVSGVYSVSAGSTLNLFVGGAALTTTPGYNGGGLAGENAGAGGGASDVRINDTSLTSRIIVAAGGGGGGNGAHTTSSTYSLKGGDGGGGGANGTDGSNTFAGFGGFGGVASTGGVNGAGCSCCMGVTGQNGSTGIGGNGGDGTSIYSGLAKTSGGGGGGGFVGGGGGGGGTAGTIGCTFNETGAGGGGAGGSNYIDPLFTSPSITNAAAPAGNGQIVITYTVVTPPTPSFSINDNNQCLTGNNFEFTNTSVNATSYLWDFGDGTTSTIPSSTHSYSTDGTYDVKLVAISSVAGCKDSIVSNVTIKPVSASVDVVTACNSFVWIDGITYNSNNNTASHLLTNSVGCDSLVTLNLTINHSTTGTDVKTACDSYTWINGVTYTSSNNTATYPLANADGCDSIVTLNLTINSNTGTDIQTACNSYTWIDGVTYTTSNNLATFLLTNAAGCDSVVTLNLTINTVSLGVTLNGATITANTSGLEYQWLDCNNNYAPIAGQISQSFTATSNGNYAAKITEGQCVDTTICTAITTVGVSENESNIHSINVYPNPVSNQFMITAFDNKEIIKFEIVNALGQVVFNGSFNEKTVVETSSFASGIYTIKLQNGTSIDYKKIVKE